MTPFRREWREPEALQYQEDSRSAEKYPGGEGNFKEQGPNTRYHWKQDREDFQRMRPLTIAPPEKRGKSCEERDYEFERPARDEQEWAQEHDKESRKEKSNIENDE